MKSRFPARIAFFAVLVWIVPALGAPERTAKGGWHLSQKGASHLSSAPAPAPATRVDFERQIEPIIKDRCLECHSQDKRKGGLSLATYADALDGGRNGPAIRPGHSARSILIHRLTGAVEPQMPKDKDPLTPRQIALIRQWIDQGARRTPASARAPQPWEAPLALTKPAVPGPTWAGWEAPLDRLVAKYLATHQTARPTAVTDAMFARRVYLDVWGLLPTPEELQRFIDDPAAEKRATLVQALLGDDQKYAEHW